MIDIAQVKEEDIARIAKFCQDNGKRLPKEAGASVYAENRETGEILGYVHVATKTFIDPFVLDEKLSVVQRVRVLERLFDTVTGLCIATGNKDIYFTAMGKDFIEFLEKKYGVEKYTDEATYIGEV